MVEPLVLMEGIDKSFPGVRTLVQARFELLPGEVHALVGENGAGKSTLMKVLAGINTKDAGRIFINGKEVEIANPRAAQPAYEMGYRATQLLLDRVLGQNDGPIQEIVLPVEVVIR